MTRFEQEGLLLRCGGLSVWFLRVVAEELVDEGEVFWEQALLVHRRKHDTLMSWVGYSGLEEKGKRVLLG